MKDSPNEREALECTLADVKVVMLPERALYYPDEQALIVADLHWGKAASMRASFVPVPTGTTAADLARLSLALEYTGATRLIVLGDLLHAKNGRQEGTLQTIAAWRRKNANLEIVLVRGNHDTHAGDPPGELDIRCQDAPFDLGAFTCVHDPIDDFADGSFILGGHLHPSVSLTGKGRERVRLPCFVCSESVAVLPAFSSFTGSGMYEYVNGDRLYAIVENAVVPVAAKPLPRDRGND
jgi:uncharacterized protein